jgi:hypothetical protein
MHVCKKKVPLKVPVEAKVEDGSGDAVQTNPTLPTSKSPPPRPLAKPTIGAQAAAGPESLPPAAAGQAQWLVPSMTKVEAEAALVGKPNGETGAPQYNPAPAAQPTGRCVLCAFFLTERTLTTQ